MTKEAGAVLAAFLEEVWNAHDLESFGRFVAPDVVFHPPRGPPVGYDGYLAMAREFLAAFPDLRFEVARVVSDGDEAAARIRITGTHEGAWRSLHPTGRRGTVVGRPWCRVRDGRIVEFWQLFDELGMLAQTGHVVDLAMLGHGAATE